MSLYPGGIVLVCLSFQDPMARANSTAVANGIAAAAEQAANAQMMQQQQQQQQQQQNGNGQVRLGSWDTHSFSENHRFGDMKMSY